MGIVDRVGAAADIAGPRTRPLRPPAPADAAPAHTAQDQTGAIIAVAPAGSDGRPVRAAPRPLATFVAHLIATDQQAPQTRTLRRASPNEAIAAYAATARRAAISGEARVIRL